MFDTCIQIFSLNFSSAANRLLYYIKRLPLIGKLFPDDLYAALELKKVLGIIAAIIKVLANFFGKLLYVFLMVLLPTMFILGKQQPQTKIIGFIHIFFFLSFVVGAVQSSKALENSSKSYNCVRLMRMNARRYTITTVIFAKFSECLCFIPAIIISGLGVGLPPLEGALFVILMFGIKLGGEALSLFLFRYTKINVYKKLWFIIPLILLGLVAAYIPILFHHPFPIRTILLNPLVIVLFIIIGLFSLFYILKFPLYEQALRTVIIRDDLSMDTKRIEKQVLFKDVELTDKDFTQSTPSSLHLESKTGYDYLNALFFKRHRRLLWKPVVIRVIIVGLLVIVGIPLILLFPEDASKLASKINSTLPGFVFIMYFISIGDRICRAMFYNCDISLLRYAYYRKPSVILHNFRIRLIRVAAMNSLIAASICAGILILIFTASGLSALPALLPFMLSILCLSLFFSVHHLFLYYVLQPYTTELDMKNPLFSVINWGVYIVCYLCMRIDSPPAYFTVIVIVSTIIYMSIALLLTYKLSPKTFRVK